MELKDIQKEKPLKTAFISARVKPENHKWFRENRIDMDLVIEKLKNDVSKQKGESQ